MGVSDSAGVGGGSAAVLGVGSPTGWTNKRLELYSRKLSCSGVSFTLGEQHSEGFLDLPEKALRHWRINSKSLWLCVFRHTISAENDVPNGAVGTRMRLFTIVLVRGAVKK